MESFPRRMRMMNLQSLSNQIGAFDGFEFGVEHVPEIVLKEFELEGEIVVEDTVKERSLLNRGPRVLQTCVGVEEREVVRRRRAARHAWSTPASAAAWPERARWRRLPRDTRARETRTTAPCT